MMADGKKRSKKLRREDLKILKMLETPANDTSAAEKLRQPLERDTVERLIHILETDGQQEAA